MDALDELAGDKAFPVAAMRLAKTELQKFVEEYKQEYPLMVAAEGRKGCSWWHRRSNQRVLAVVVARKGGELIFARGMNSEVSLPNGSQCAERTAIAALETRFVSATDILAVAVADPEDKINPLWPCKVCESWLTKMVEQSPELTVMAVKDSSCEEFQIQEKSALLEDAVKQRVLPRRRMRRAEEPAPLTAEQDQSLGFTAVRAVLRMELSLLGELRLDTLEKVLGHHDLSLRAFGKASAEEFAADPRLADLFKQQRKGPAEDESAAVDLANEPSS